MQYDDLILIPSLIAETVATSQFKGQDLSEGTRSESDISKIEEQRRNMTREQIEEFATAVDKRCRAAYEANADWFMKCVRSKTNRGRDQLYIWVTHWLASYLNNPERFVSLK